MTTTLVFYLHISRLETSQKVQGKKSKQNIFLILTFWKEIRRGFFVLGGVDRLRLFLITLLI